VLAAHRHLSNTTDNGGIRTECVSAKKNGTPELRNYCAGRFFEWVTISTSFWMHNAGWCESRMTHSGNSDTGEAKPWPKKLFQRAGDHHFSGKCHPKTLLISPDLVPAAE
jgi:hypothetical protein